MSGRRGPSVVLATTPRRGGTTLRARFAEPDPAARLARIESQLAEPAFHAYLGCGDPAAGFAWLHCADCHHHRLVLFSCKTRGFCPSCAGRRMAERAAHLVDRVIPHVATRQYAGRPSWQVAGLPP